MYDVQLILRQASCGTPVDLWSLGCILAELLLQRPLFAARCPAALLKLVSIAGCATYRLLQSSVPSDWHAVKALPASLMYV